MNSNRSKISDHSTPILIPNNCFNFLLYLFGLDLNKLFKKRLQILLPTMVIMAEAFHFGVYILLLIENKNYIPVIIELEREITNSLGLIFIYLNRDKWSYFLKQLHTFLEEEEQQILSTWCLKIVVIYFGAVISEVMIWLSLNTLNEIYESALPSYICPSSPYFELITCYIIVRSSCFSHGWAYLMILFYVYIFCNVHVAYKKFYIICQNYETFGPDDNFQLHDMRLIRRRLQHIKRKLDHSLSLFPVLLFSRNFLESCLCILKAARRDEKMTLFSLFDDWTVYITTTVFMIGMTIFIDRVNKLEIDITNFLLIKVLSNYRSNLNCRFQEILFSQELIRSPYIPITVGRIFKVSTGSLILF